MTAPSGEFQWHTNGALSAYWGFGGSGSLPRAMRFAPLLRGFPPFRRRGTRPRNIQWRTCQAHRAGCAPLGARLWRANGRHNAQ